MRITENNIVSVLRQTRPDVYKEILETFQPCKYPLSIIDKLYSALPSLQDRSHFFGCVVLLFRKSVAPKIKRQVLFDGTGCYISKVTGMEEPNVSVEVNRANFRLHRLKGFEQECRVLLNTILK